MRIPADFRRAILSRIPRYILLLLLCSGCADLAVYVRDRTLDFTDVVDLKYGWCMGQTIRPNGEVLEGNPAHVDEYIPVTRENYLGYYDILLSRAFAHLEAWRSQ